MSKKRKLCQKVRPRPFDELLGSGEVGAGRIRGFEAQESRGGEGQSGRRRWGLAQACE
jgi:hypothetical protein